MLSQLRHVLGSLLVFFRGCLFEWLFVSARAA